MSTTVLATKLFRPSGRERLVDRPRLVEELDRSLTDHHRLTLVSAPPGFGKTTLLSRWLDSRAQEKSGVRAAWLSLDEGDNDPSRFLRHVVAALHRCGVDLEWTAKQTVADHVAVLTELLNAVVLAGEQASHRHWLLVLDDYHLIEAPMVHEAVTFLLDSLPRQLHLVVSTRADPPLPLARLRSREQLVELRVTDLRFTASEARDFLRQVMGLDLTVGDIEALEERTEGWVAGLQLAALSLRNTRSRDESDRFIAAFTGSNRFVVDYLVDEVLIRLPAQVHRFLLQTSVLNRLSGPLCDAVTGGSGSVSMLQRLERDNVFVVALDAERSWYRYHQLFADVLRARLHAAHPDEVASLHARASEWYADHDFVSEAVHHASAGGDHPRAAHLIEQALPYARRARQDATLVRWIEALPEKVVCRSPVLTLISAWSMMMAGDLDAMERRLADADAALTAGARDPGLRATWADTEDLRTAPATLSVYRAALAQARGDVAGTVRHAQRALDLAGPDDHLVRGASGGFLGLAAWADGEVERGLTTFSDAVRSLRAAGNHVDALDSTVVLADMWMTAGRPATARIVYEQALVAAAGQGEPLPRATADLHVGLADLDRERNDLEEARAQLDVAKVLAERASITENRHRWYVVSAMLSAATGDHATAIELLDRAQTLYRPGFYPDIRPIPAMRARVHIAAGDVESAERWAADLGLALHDEATFLREYEHLTLVRLHLAHHERDLAEPRTADAPTARLDQVMQALHRVHVDAQPSRAATMLEVGMLRALTLHAAGDSAAAFAELDRTLLLAPEPGSYVRLFLDEGQPMLDLLVEALRTPRDDHSETLRDHARRLLHVPRVPGAPISDDDTPKSRDARAGVGYVADPLSDRELEVLRMLATDLTGPEIARQLYVSVNTLRTHTKRIYTKLDVTSRSAAVRRGRQLHLL